MKQFLVLILVFQFLTIPLYPSFNGLSIARVYAQSAEECIAQGIAPGDCVTSNPPTYFDPAPFQETPEGEIIQPEPVYVPPPYVPPQQRYVPPPEPVYEPEYVQEIPYEEVPPAQTDPVAPQEQPVSKEVSLYQACLNSLTEQEVCDNLFGISGPPVPGPLEPTEPVSPGEVPAQESGNWWDNLNPLSWTEPVQQWFEERAEEAGEIWDGTMEGARELASNIFGGGSKEPGSASKPDSIAVGPVPQDPQWSAKIAQANSDWKVYLATALADNPDPEAVAAMRAQTISGLGLPADSTDDQILAFVSQKFTPEGVAVSGSPEDIIVDASCAQDPNCGLDATAVTAPTLAAQAAGTAGRCDPEMAIRHLEGGDAVLDMTCRPEVTDTQELLKLQAESDKALAEINKAKSSEATGNILDLAGQYLACNAVPIPLVDAAAAYFFESCRDANEKVAALGTGIATSIAASGTSRNEFYGDDGHNNDCKTIVAGFARSRPASLAEATGMLESSGCYYDTRTPEQRKTALEDTINPEGNPNPDMYAALAAAGLPATGWRATKIKNLANELEFDLSNPNADPAKRDNFIARLIASDPEATTVVIENVFSFPVTALQNEAIARRICERDEGTDVCDLGSLDPNTRLAQSVRAAGYYLDLSEDDAKGLNSDAAALFPNFQAADLEKVKQYVTARSNIVVPGVTAEDEELRRIRTAEAMRLSIDDPEFKMIEETIAVWNSTSDQTLANSSAGRLLGEAKAEADTQGIIGALSLGLDSPDFLEVGIAGFMIARKALPKLVGKNGIRTIKEAEEFAIQNGWELADDGLMEAKRLELAQGQARPNAPEPAGPAPEVPGRAADDTPARAPDTEEIAEAPGGIADIPVTRPVGKGSPPAPEDEGILSRLRNWWEDLTGGADEAPTPEVKPQAADELASAGRVGDDVSTEPIAQTPGTQGPEQPGVGVEVPPARTVDEPTSIRPEEPELPCAASLPLQFRLIKEVYAQDEGRRPCSIFNPGDWGTMVNRALGRAEPEPVKAPEAPAVQTAEVPAANQEIAIEGPINEVNEVLTLQGQPFENGCRALECGLGSALIKRAAEKDGIKADAYQLEHLHELLGANREDVFGHGFTILEKDGKRYIGDLTFVQFVQKNDTIVSWIKMSPRPPLESLPSIQEDIKNGVLSLADVREMDRVAAERVKTQTIPPGRPSADFPAIQELNTKGYIPLTDENLRQYLKASAGLGLGDDYLRKIDQTTVDDIIPNLTPLPPYRSDAELDAILARVETPNPKTPDVPGANQADEIALGPVEPGFRVEDDGGWGELLDQPIVVTRTDAEIQGAGGLGAVGDVLEDIPVVGPSVANGLRGIGDVIDDLIPGPAKVETPALKAERILKGDSLDIPLVPETIDPPSVFASAFKQGLETGRGGRAIYTELHLGPDGKLYIIPQTVSQDSHWATTHGYHSFFDSIRGSSLDRYGFARQLPFTTNSIIAKGHIVTPDGKSVEFLIDPATIRDRDYVKLKGLPQDPPLNKTFLEDLTDTAEEVGVSRIVNEKTEAPLNYKVGDPPQVSAAVYVRPQDSGKGTLDDILPPRPGRINSGFLEGIGYSPQRGDILSSPGVSVGYDLLDAAAKTHEEAATRFKFSDPHDYQPVKIGSQEFNVLARHTVDPVNKEMQIYLILKGLTGTDDIAKLQDFEFALFSSYLKNLGGLPATHYDPDFNIKLITTYQLPEGNIGTRIVEGTGLEDLKGLTSDKDLYSDLAARPLQESKVKGSLPEADTDLQVGKADDGDSPTDPCPTGISLKPSIFNFVKEVYAAGPCPIQISAAGAEAAPSYHTPDDRRVSLDNGGVVLDGVSQEAKGSGSVAADIARPILAKMKDIPREIDPNDALKRMEEIFEEADLAIDADRAIHTLSDRSILDQRAFRGTTGTAVLVVHHNGDEYAVTVYVGDSPANLRRGNSLIDLTPNALSPTIGNVLGRTRNSGGPPTIQHTITKLNPGDEILIRSDGVSIDEPQIVQIMRSTPNRTADELVSASKRAGEKDDVTAIVVRPEMTGVAPAARSAAAPASGPNQIGEALRTFLSPWIAVPTTLAALAIGFIYYALTRTPPPASTPDVSEPAEESVEAGEGNGSERSVGLPDPAQSKTQTPEQKELEEKVANDTAEVIEQVSEVTVIQENQPTCNDKGESIIATQYSNGYSETIKNYGKVPGECGNKFNINTDTCPAGQTMVEKPYTQCGGSVGMEDELKGVNYRVTRTYVCKKNTDEIAEITYKKEPLDGSKANPNACPVEFAAAEKLKEADSFIKPGQKCAFDWECQEGYQCNYVYKSCIKSRKVTKLYYENKPEDKTSYDFCHELGANYLKESNSKYSGKAFNCYQDPEDENSKLNGRKVQVSVFDIASGTNEARCQMDIVDVGPGVNCPASP